MWIKYSLELTFLADVDVNHFFVLGFFFFKNDPFTRTKFIVGVTTWCFSSVLCGRSAFSFFSF